MNDFENIYKYSKNLHILYVEDDISLLKETTNVLNNFFASVTTAFNGEEALEKYIKYKSQNREYFDLVITDINMPKKDGMELISDIKRINKKQSVLVVSAYDESNRLIDMIGLGIDGFILKPIKIEQLLSQFTKICEVIFTLKEKESIMLLQSKNAAMGEMIDSIAHQWMQPLSIINMKTDLFYELSKDEGNINLAQLKECSSGVKLQISHLTDTLQQFRDFFKVKNSFEVTTYKKLVESVLVLLKDNLIKHTVETQLLLENNDSKIEVIPNEFKHVLINLINNSIEAFRENNIKNRTITFHTQNIGNDLILNIRDNAGGMPENIMKDIFSLNYTTKKEGTGVGLYLSRQILNKLDGTLKVHNVKNGVEFSITLKKLIN